VDFAGVCAPFAGRVGCVIWIPPPAVFDAMGGPAGRSSSGSRYLTERTVAARGLGRAPVRRVHRALPVAVGTGRD